MKKIILIIICLFFITGCYDYQELSDMSIVDGIGFDYKNDQYKITFEVIKSIKSGDSALLSSETVTAEDEVLANAINKAIERAGKRVSLKHVKTILISKNMATKGINPIVDYIIRDVNVSTNLYTLICDDPANIFNTKVQDNTMGSVINDTITYNLEGEDLDNIDVIASHIINKNIDIALPFIKLDNQTVITDQIAYFKDSQLIDLIDSKIYNFLILNSNNIDFNKDNTVLNIYNKDIKYQVNKHEINIYIKGDAKVKQVDNQYNLEKIKDYSKIEKIINEQIKQETYDFLKETLNNNADLIGLKDKYYKTYHKKKENINYTIDVDIKINKNGAIYEVLND